MGINFLNSTKGIKFKLMIGMNGATIMTGQATIMTEQLLCA